MSWLGLVPSVVVALVILVGPGFAIAWSAGARWVTAVLVSPPLSIGVVGIASLGAGFAGIGWGWLPIVAVTAVLAAGGLAIRWISRRRESEPVDLVGASRDIWALVGVCVAALAIALVMVRALPGPESFSQTFDAVFHLNGLRWVAEQGDASPLTLTRMTSADEGPYFYPSMWHATGGLVAMTTGVSAPAAANALNIALAAVVWPLGALALVIGAVRLRPAVGVLAGLVMAGFSGLPYLLLEYGVLYPNFLSYTLAPGALALIAALFARTDRPLLRPLAAFCLTVLGFLGVALAHPNGALLVVAAGLPILVAAAWSAGRSWWRERKGWWLAGLAAAVVAVALGYVVVWDVIRPPEEATGWPPFESKAQAIGEVLLNAGSVKAAGYGVSLLAIIGAGSVLTRRMRSRWLVASWVVIAFLFIVVASFTAGPFRDALTAVWYNNAPRLAAGLPVLAAPLAVVGLSFVWKAARRWVADSERSRSRWVVVGAGAVALALTIYGTATFSAARVTWVTVLTEDSRLINADEYELIQELPELVGPDARLAVEPWYGGSMAYALAGVDVTHRHILDGQDAELALIDEQLRWAEPGSAVCEAIEEEGVTHVLDFSPPAVHGGVERVPGLTNLWESDAVEFVTAVGGARLYEIVGCG